MMTIQQSQFIWTRQVPCLNQPTGGTSFRPPAYLVLFPKGGIMYPENDEQYENRIITKVNGMGITTDDGWSFTVQEDSPIKPKEGMMARFYGQGIGHTVRGLFLDGVQVYYRIEIEDKEYRAKEMYGADVTEWLKRWDAGETIWSIEMGGLGPGYEQCIQITIAEILRFMLGKNYDVTMADKDECKIIGDEIEKMGHSNPVIDKLGLSGAQWGAAMNLACQFYRKGPCVVMSDEQVKDRHIQ